MKAVLSSFLLAYNSALSLFLAAMRAAEPGASLAITDRPTRRLLNLSLGRLVASLLVCAASAIAWLVLRTTRKHGVTLEGLFATSADVIDRSASSAFGGNEDREVVSRRDGFLHDPRMFPMLFDEVWLRTHATSPAGYLAGRPELLVEVPRRVPFAELKHASNECLNNVLGFKGKHPLPQPSFNGSDGWALKISSAIFQEPRAHWIFFVLPLVNHVRRARLSGGPVFLLVNNLDTSGIKGHHKSVLWERKILVYITSQLDGIIYLRDAEHNARLEPKLPACTRTVGVPSKLPSSMINRDDYLYARRILSRFAQRPLYQHCRERRLHKPVVWILDRRIWSRRLRNRADIEMLVREEMGDDVEIRVFDSPNTDCENYIKGFANCNDAHPVYLAQDYPFFHASHRSERANDMAGSADSIATTDKSVSWSPSSSLPLPAQSDFDYDAALFNNITFLIAVHGGGLMNEWLLPEGSVAIEIYPYGVMDTSYRQLYANTNASGLHHLMYHDKNDSQARQAFGSVRAGDLWNSANRGKVKGLSVEVSIRKMRWAIRHSYELWRNSCSLATDWGIN